MQGGFQNALHALYGLPGGWIMEELPPTGGHYPPMNAKGSALGKDWKSKRQKKLLALKKEVLPEVTNKEFLNLVSDIEGDVFAIPKKRLRLFLLAMMMDD